MRPETQVIHTGEHHDNADQRQAADLQQAMDASRA